MRVAPTNCKEQSLAGVKASFGRPRRWHIPAHTYETPSTQVPSRPKAAHLQKGLEAPLKFILRQCTSIQPNAVQKCLKDLAAASPKHC